MTLEIMLSKRHSQGIPSQDFVHPENIDYISSSCQAAFRSRDVYIKQVTAANTTSKVPVIQVV